jgi:hypothetical protein
VLKVLHRLQERGLQLDIDKYEFGVKEVKYLGLIILTDGVKMDPKKLEAIENWEIPRLAADIQAFLGFANFYRRFIANFSALTRPLNNRMKGEAFTTCSGKKKIRYVPFIWTPKC